MSNHKDELATLGEGPIYFLETDAQDKVIAKLLDTGWRIVHVEGSAVESEASFFSEVARVCEFPSYFGKNWNAFNDCWSDYVEGQVRPDARPMAVVWTNARIALNAHSPTLLQAVHSFVGYPTNDPRAAGEVPVIVLIIGL